MVVASCSEFLLDEKLESESSGISEICSCMQVCKSEAEQVAAVTHQVFPFRLFVSSWLKSSWPARSVAYLISVVAKCCLQKPIHLQKKKAS